MTKLRVHAFSISLDGYGAGPNQSLEHPLGVGGEELHEWIVATRMFKQLYGGTGRHHRRRRRFRDARLRRTSAPGFSAATCSGRSAAPGRTTNGRAGGATIPPYHTDVFVLTHHPRASIRMAGDTTFHFVTEGIHAALERAKAAAKGRDVRLGGGAATIQQYLRAGLIDEMHLAIAPVLLGSGEHLFAGLDLLKLGYRCVEHVPSSGATHVVLKK